MRSTFRQVVLLLAAALCGGGVAVLVAGRATSHSTTVVSRLVRDAAASRASNVNPARGGTMTPAQIYRSDAPGVVVVRSTLVATQTDAFGLSQRQTEQALGSGFVIDTRGHILTNA
ncbi:MAG TPA: S1C family serine protease, partial [Gaiellales bacterium]|nr:S1C family serine protease [Gaiellales bacterium]